MLPPASLRQVAEGARHAAELGFDGVLAAETSHDPFLALGAAAAAAPGLELGTAIAVAFPRSPMVTAQLAWDLADLSGGRFILGLGTQVRAHIVRRFSGEWGSPVARIRDYVLSLRAIWNCWQHGGPLGYEGRFYRFSLMTPFFDPGPIEHPEIPVALAAVNPAMCRLAGEMCQGLHVHPLHTVGYLDEVVRPAIASGARAVGRDPGEVGLMASIFLVTGRDEAEMAASAAVARSQIAFYASTPTYRRLLDHHGWDMGPALSAMSRRGEWAEMGDLIPDEVLRQVAVVAPIERLGDALLARYGSRLRRVSCYSLDQSLGDEIAGALIAASRG